MKRFMLLVFLFCMSLAVLSTGAAQAQTLYAVDRVSNLYTMDPATGATTLMGPTGIDRISAIAFHPITGVLYAATGGSSSNNACIYTLNTITGAATLVGCDPREEAGASAIPGIAFRSDGTLFAILEWMDVLAVIDTATSATAIIGEGMGGSGWMQGLTFTPEDVLIHSGGSSADGAFYITDQTTGLDEFLAEYNFYGFPLFECTPGFNDMSYNQDGILYGLVLDNCEGGGIVYLATADPYDGDIVYVAQLSSAIHAIAWGPPDAAEGIDLIVPLVDGPGTASKNSMVTITAAVQNIGGEPLVVDPQRPLAVKFYLLPATDGGGEPTPTGIQEDGIYFGVHFLAGGTVLNPGDIVTIVKRLRLPNIKGTYQIWAFADATGLYAESNEENNTGFDPAVINIQ